MQPAQPACCARQGPFSRNAAPVRHPCAGRSGGRPALPSAGRCSRCCCSTLWTTRRRSAGGAVCSARLSTLMESGLREQPALALRSRRLPLCGARAEGREGLPFFLCQLKEDRARLGRVGAGAPCAPPPRCLLLARRVSAMDSGKPMVDAAFGEVRRQRGGAVAGAEKWVQRNRPSTEAGLYACGWAVRSAAADWENAY